MVRTLAAGAVSVHPSTLFETVHWAKQYEFAGIDFNIHQVAALGTDTAQALFAENGVAPAVFGLPVDWRGSEATWKQGLDELAHLAAAAQAVGCTRTATWIMPASNDRPRGENQLFHVERFRPIAEILGEYGISLGLEFIGPKTLRDQFTHPFIWTMGDMLEMASQIGPNVGLLLDCFHWYTSHGSIADLQALTPEQVVYVHVNDVPAGLEIDQQIDNQRRLPSATGVIDLPGFLGALREIGFDGPVAAEPFDDSLKLLPSDGDRLAATRDSMAISGL